LITSFFEKKMVRFLGMRSERQEKQLIAWSGVTTAVSEFDKILYQQLSGVDDKIKVFSNVIDVSEYRQKTHLPDLAPKKYLLLTGYFGPASPTDLAARWFINNVFPLIHEKEPTIHLIVAGKGADYTLSDIRHANIYIVGQVASMLPYLGHAQAALVPLQYESGTRFKILEAGVCRVPVVSTTLGAEGLHVEDGEHLLIADTEQQFAESVLRILQDKKLATKLATNLYTEVIKNYSISALKEEGQQIIKYLEKAV
jgi:glycosyltransferase involved in cell wall biosynthesis